MDKQEEMAEWINKYLTGQFICDPTELPDDECRNEAREILSYLHSQGVGIKAKCPDCSWSQFGDEVVGMTPCYSCNSTGYIVESLIKEE